MRRTPAPAPVRPRPSSTQRRTGPGFGAGTDVGRGRAVPRARAAVSSALLYHTCPRLSNSRRRSRKAVVGCRFALSQPCGRARQRRAADGSPGRSARGARKPWGDREAMPSPRRGRWKRHVSSIAPCGGSVPYGTPLLRFFPSTGPSAPGPGRGRCSAPWWPSTRRGSWPDPPQRLPTLQGLVDLRTTSSMESSPASSFSMARGRRRCPATACARRRGPRRRRRTSGPCAPAPASHHLCTGGCRLLHRPSPSPASRHAGS